MVSLISKFGTAFSIYLLLSFGYVRSDAQLSSANSSEIQVRIYSLHSVKQLTVSPLEEVSWKPCANCRARALIAPMTINASGNELQYGNSNSSKSYAGQKLYLAGKYRLQVSQERLFENRYPLEVTARNGGLILVITMPMEDYVAAVLAGESSNFQSNEALKAMAVAVRTYAVHFRGRHQIEGFDFCDTTHCQDLRLSAVSERQHAAAEVTEGELLWFKGTPAATYYHQNCGGTAAAANEAWPGTKADYLTVHADPYCVRSEHARWESRISKSDLSSALAKAGVQMPADWQTFKINVRNRSGRVQLLDVIDKSGRPAMKLSASTLRFAAGRTLGWNQLKSDLYEIRDDGNEILFSGRGSGHGVGFCQEGADAMGKQGKNYREILAFYFPGTALGVSAQGLTWHRLHSEEFDLLTTDENADARILAVIARTLHKTQLDSGLELKIHPVLKVYPTIAIYRDSTGEPGWVAASTRGSVIRLQPWQLLEQKGVLDSTLRHEFLHLLVEGNIHASLPLWFREGLVLYLANEAGFAHSTKLSPEEMESALRNSQGQSNEQMQKVYASARTTVADLVARWGKAEVIGWLSRGIAAGALASRPTAQSAQH